MWVNSNLPKIDGKGSSLADELETDLENCYRFQYQNLIQTKSPMNVKPREGNFFFSRWKNTHRNLKCLPSSV